MSDPSQHVIFCSDDPPIVMMYDSRNGTHSVWKIRKAYHEVRKYSQLFFFSRL